MPTHRSPGCSAAPFWLMCSRQINHCLALSWLLGIIMANDNHAGLLRPHGCLTSYWPLCLLIEHWSVPCLPLAALQLLDTSLVLSRPGGHRTPSQAPNNQQSAGWPVRYGAYRRRRVAKRAPSAEPGTEQSVEGFAVLLNFAGNNVADSCKAVKMYLFQLRFIVCNDIQCI